MIWNTKVSEHLFEEPQPLVIDLVSISFAPFPRSPWTIKDKEQLDVEGQELADSIED
jgi:hypothetical protein